MTRVARAPNRTAPPKAGFLAPHLQRARRSAAFDPATTTFVVAVIASTAAGVARGAPIATAVTVVALVPTALVDLRSRRLPNRGLLAAPTAGATVGAIELLIGSRLDHASLDDLVLGTLALAAPLLVLHLASPSSMGFGDVKLGIVLGVALAPLDPIAGLVALAVAGAVGAIAGAVHRQRTIPFGPALVAGAAVATVISPGLVAR